MKGMVKTVFPGNNSAEGFFSFYESGLSAMERIYILKGGPGTGKSSFMRRLGESFRERGNDVEFWQCSSDNNSLDGVILPGYKTAIIDGTAPHTVDPVYPGARETLLDLGVYWRQGALFQEREAIIALTDRISCSFASAYRQLKTAGEWDDRLLGARSVVSVPRENCEELIREVFGRDTLPVRHLFSAAVTPQGIVDYTFDLCRDLKRRFFLQGQRGLGQQFYLHAVAKAAADHGIAAEIYHGHLRHEELTMVILPELSTAVAAVEAIPGGEVREGDRILSFQGENCKEEEKQAKKERDTAVAAAVKEIAKAHELHDELEVYYSAAMDFDAVERLEKSIFQIILKNASKE